MVVVHHCLIAACYVRIPLIAFIYLLGRDNSVGEENSRKKLKQKTIKKPLKDYQQNKLKNNANKNSLFSYLCFKNANNDSLLNKLDMIFYYTGYTTKQSGQRISR